MQLFVSVVSVAAVVAVIVSHGCCCLLWMQLFVAVVSVVASAGAMSVQFFVAVLSVVATAGTDVGAMMPHAVLEDETRAETSTR